MKRLVFSIAILMASIAAPCQTFQNGIANAVQVSWHYQWPGVTTTGPIGYNATFHPQGTYIYPYEGTLNNLTIAWTVNGTVSACTWRIEGSNDAATWTGLDATSPATDPNACTSANATSVVNRPFAFYRINVVTFTGTGNVVFTYVGGK